MVLKDVEELTLKRISKTADLNGIYGHKNCSQNIKKANDWCYVKKKYKLK